MPLSSPVLVRCASCAHNFESRLSGRIRCPVCHAEVWLEPPGGGIPDRPEDGAEPPPAPQPPPVHPRDDPDPPAEVSPVEDAAAPFDAAPAGEGGETAGEGDAFQPPAEAEAIIPAWEGRQGGFVRRFYDTCRQILTNPPRFFAGLKVDRLYGSWSFAWILCSLAALFVSLYGLWNLERNEAALLDALRAEPGVKPEQVVASLRDVLTFGAWGAPLFGLLNAWLTAVLYHLGVMLLGSSRRGFRATFRATAYGFAPLLLVVVPVVGQLIGSLWAIVLQVVAIAHVHRMGPGRAALAVLLPLAATLALLLVLW